MRSNPVLTHPDPAPPRIAPQLIFYTELTAVDLDALLDQPELLALLRQYGGKLAMAMRELDQRRAAVVRRLRAHEIGVIAWLQADEEGQRLNLQNYPQAITGYQRFQEWAGEQGLTFSGVGLDMRLPAGELRRLYDQGISGGLQRIWLARENVLYAAARAAYHDLIAGIRHDGHETHIFQTPLLIDDRIAGTTLVQRALNVVDVPADVEVLLCYSALPVGPRPVDTGGALIAGYGGWADAMAVGSSDGRGSVAMLPWESLRRDLLLAAQFTDTIYVCTLESCAADGLLPQLRALDWEAAARPWRKRQLLLLALRGQLVSWLLLVRFGPMLFGWAGWVVALVLIVQRVRRRWR